METDYLARLHELYSGRYWGLIGVEPVTVESGRVTNRLLIRAEHLNYNHVVHGGVVSSMIDIASGAAVGTLRTSDEVKARPHATSDLHVTYISAATGTQLTADARVVKAGRTAVFTEVEVTDDRDRVIARGMVTYIISAGRGAASSSTAHQLK